MSEWREEPGHPYAFRCGPLVAIRSHDGGRWHLSVSRADRVPTWDEMGAARDALLPPDAFFAVPHPPRALWLNLHPYCLHLWEVRDSVLVRIWRNDGEEAQRAGYGVPTGEATGGA